MCTFLLARSRLGGKVVREISGIIDWSTKEQLARRMAPVALLLRAFEQRARRRCDASLLPVVIILLAS